MRHSNPADDAVALDDGQLQRSVADRRQDLPCAARLLELGADKLDGIASPLVRIKLDAPAPYRTSPGGRVKRSAPRPALLSLEGRPRCRRRLSSY